MKAVVCQNAELAVDELPDPVPAKGQVRLQTLRCGICGSDLHARTGTDHWAEMAVRGGYHRFGRSHEQVVFGHEFCGEVAEHGPGSRKTVPAGTPVAVLPLIRNAGHIDPIGLSSHAPGGYAEQVLAQESLIFPVPNGLSPEIAALTEPMAVGWHAVRRADVRKRTVSVVIGCGPVGLAVILFLKAQGVRTVIASDFSPARRELAARCGADIVVDPAESSPYDRLTGRDLLEDMPSALELAVGSVEKLDRLPVDWWHVWRLGERLGLAEPKHPVIFECVGVPGVIDQILDAAPLFSRVVVVGVCVGPDTITPAMAINKEIDLRFVVAYTPLEFRDTLRMLAEGKVDPSPLVTGSVGLEGVDAAFAALADPERHAKILVDPRSRVTEPA